jgi:hypothetical protein
MSNTNLTSRSPAKKSEDGFFIRGRQDGFIVIKKCV